MKYIKFLVLITILGMFTNSCVVEEGENPFYSPTAYGVYPVYTDIVNGFFDIIDVCDIFSITSHGCSSIS